MTVNQTELAELFDVTPRTIRTWEREGLPHESAGRSKRYDLRAAIRWHRDREVARALAPYEGTQLEHERTRLVRARAEEAERRNAIERRRLIAMEDVAALVRAPLQAVDRALKAAPRRHAKRWARVLRVKEGEALELIETLVEDVRADLRRLAE